MKINIGRYKAYYQRVILYLTAVNFFMIFYNFQVVNDWMPWYGWVIAFAMGMTSIAWFDVNHVWEDEVTETAKKNRILMDNNRLLRKIAGEEENKW